MVGGPRLVSVDQEARRRRRLAYSFDSREVEVVATQFEFQNRGISFRRRGHRNRCIQTNCERRFDFVNERDVREFPGTFPRNFRFNVP